MLRVAPGMLTRQGSIYTGRVNAHISRFQFLPVIGGLVKARIEGTLDSDTSRRFAFRKDITHEDGSRVGQRPLVLREEDLAL